MHLLLDTLQHDLRGAARSLAKSPGFVITAVLSLAFGIGASAAAFSVLDAVRFRALPFRDADRLVLLSEVPIVDARPVNGGGASGSGASDCRSACDVSYETFSRVLQPYPFRALDAVAGYTSGIKGYSAGGEVTPVRGGVVSQNLFALLGVAPLRGRVFSPEDDRLGVPLVTILSYDFWTKQFGQDPAMLGRVIKLSDSRYTVIGIMPPGFNHEVGSQFWMPAVPTLDPSTRPSIRTLTVIGRLAPGRTVEQLRGELATIEPAPAASSARGTPIATRLVAMPLRARYAASTKSHDLIFAAVVACVLLIACTNLANIVLVRTLHQQREFAVRAALGAGTARITRHLLAQQLLLVLLATIVGLLLARWSLALLQSIDALDSLRPGGMEYRLDLRVVAFASLLALGVGALLSIVPSRLVARVDIQQVLRASTPTASGGRWGSRAQQLFVVAQIACAAVLLTGAGLMAKTVMRLARADLGFESARVLQGTPSYPHPWRVKNIYVPLADRILGELQTLPGAAAVALRASVPLSARGAPPSITLAGQGAPLSPAIAPPVAFAVSPGYFDALGVRILRGRAFTSADQELSVPVAIVNEWAARRWWPGEDAIGKMFRVDTAPSQFVTLTVVGVARDNKAAQPNVLLADEGPELYRPYLQSPSAFPSYYVRAAGAPEPLLRPMRELLVRSVPDRPLFATLVSDAVAQQLRGVRTNAMQIVGFAAVGLLLALMGIHGVLSYTVGRRTQEIGIRGALGATRGSIRAMILADAVRLTAAGLLVGLPAAAVTTRIIRGMLYGTSETDPLVYAAVALGIAAVALGASWLPARKAARVDPVVALRAG